MTKLLDEAVARLRGMSDEDQDYAAAMLLRFADREADSHQLTPEQVAEVELARKEAREALCNGRRDEGPVAAVRSDGLAGHVFN